MRGKVVFVLLFAALYTLCAIYFAFASMGAAMSGFEPGTTPASELTRNLLGNMTDVLMQPLVPMFKPRGLWAYLLIFANGVLWGSALIALWSVVQHRRNRSARLTRARG